MLGTLASVGDRRVAIARYLPNGTLDPTFGSHGLATKRVGTSIDARAMTIDHSGRILVAATARHDWDNNSETKDAYQLLIWRWSSAGALDDTFSVKGPGGRRSFVLLRPSGIAEQSIGGVFRYVVGGPSPLAPWSAVRFDEQGQRDMTFGTAGWAVVNPSSHDLGAAGMALEPGSEKIVLAGTATQFLGEGTSTPIGIVRFTSNGEPDPTFGRKGYVETAANEWRIGAGAGLAVRPSGKVMLTSSLWNRTSNFDFEVWRFNANGTPDHSFGGDGRAITDFGRHDDVPSAVVVQPDGKAVVVGSDGVSFDSPHRVRLARYQDDGTLDTTFGNGGRVVGINGVGNSVALQGTKIVVATLLEMEPSTTTVRLARYLH